MDKEMQPLPPPSREEIRDLTEMLNIVRSYVNLVIHHWSTNKRKPIGTAVMLRAGERLFAITAEHCVHSDMTVYFRREDGRDLRSKIIQTVTKKPLDIALLELETRPDVAACEIEQVSIDVPAPATKDYDSTKEPLFWVVGFPAEHAKLDNDKLNVSQEAFGTNLVGATPDDLLLYYHQEGYGVAHNALTCKLSPLPTTPEGYSGAGVWRLMQHDGDMLFNPPAACKAVRHPVRMAGYHQTTQVCPSKDYRRDAQGKLP